MSNKWFIGILAVLVIGFGAFFATRPPTPTVEKKGSLASLSTAPAPWPAEEVHLRDRMKALSLPILGVEGTALHIHSHLDIYIHGQPTVVPANIGISGFFSPIHTHDTSGIIHLESPDPNANYRLGQFLDVWGLKFSNTSIGSYKNDAVNKLIVYSNGKVVSDPVNLQLTKHEEIIITFGNTQEKPAAIPKDYQFPGSL